MQRRSFTRVRAGVAVVALLAAGPGLAQSTPAPESKAAGHHMAREDVVAFAKVSIAVAQVRDSIQKQLAQPRNKTPQAQQQLREQLAAGVEQVLRVAGISEEEYRR